jgi:aspartate-semialdehyde dehydrogenase
VKHMLATVLEPASEHGKRGMDELHDQTVNLLSFQQMPMSVFGAQIAFNVVPEYGEESKPKLADVEKRILAHYKRIVGDRLPVPSVMLLQAPVFHAHTFSIYIELESAISLEEFEAALGGDHVEIAKTLEDNPSNVNVAGQEQIQVMVKLDLQRENGFWIWVAADNLRITATMAVECAEHMATTRPRGKVQ